MPKYAITNLIGQYENGQTIAEEFDLLTTNELSHVNSSL